VPFVLLVEKESSGGALDPAKPSIVVGEDLLLCCCTTHFAEKKMIQHTSLNINANQYDLTLAMLSAGMYGKGLIRIDMDPATYD